MTNRPIASLSPSLLARKGAARPAMRPQLQPLRTFHESTARQLEDLGWNDMGTETEVPVGAPDGSEQEGALHEAEIVEFHPVGDHALPRFAEESAPAPANPRQSALSAGRRAAFTLRLDSERHLKLRLACVTSNRSAQQLVTEALDRLIAELPEVTELAGKVRKRS
jgi:predicted HicB family RNase H-like nuclease